jgi:cytochrome P450
MSVTEAGLSETVVDLSTSAFWGQPAARRGAAFAQLRAHAPVSFQRPPDFGLMPTSQGYWAVVRHEDVMTASRTPEDFCSGQGVTFEDLPADVAELTSSFVVMDAPRHTLYRKMVSGAFTPRRVVALEASIDREARAIVDAAVAEGAVDLVKAVSMRMPLWTISSLLGVPDELRPRMYELSNVLVGTNDPDVVGPDDDAVTILMGASIELQQMALELVAQRRAEPGDDVLTAIALAESEGKSLTDVELGAVFILFAVAGNDTTRNSISHAVKAFSDNPEQWNLLRSDIPGLLDSAVDEVIRWATPVIQFRRTATRDLELGGQSIREGDHVVLFYESANRDETVFENPWRFDITRTAEHVGFGGGGPHFCLGAHLARAQLRAVLGRMAETVERFEAGEPEYLVSHFIHGVKSLPVRFHPAAG